VQRWWDDPETATAVMAGVDDRDVVQGVGTAALGLHALAKAALAPLVEATLVDRVDIAQVLTDLPLDDVAKALGAATRPVVGIGSDRYGQLLAQDMAAQAAAGADHLVAVLTAGGMPMPLAVARAAEAVGLPPKRTGTYAAVTKDPQLGPLVVADAADRALMGYAEALGKAEADSVAAVAKSEFDEREHPRGQGGRFAEKPDASREQDASAGRDARKERMARRARRGHRAALAAPVEIPPAVAAAQSSLIDLARLVQAPAAEPERERERKRRPLAQLASTLRREPTPAVQVHSVLARPTPAQLHQDFTMVDLAPHDRRYMLVDHDVAEEIATGGMTVSALAAAFKSSVDVYGGTDLAALRSAALSHGHTDYSRMVAVEFPMRLPVVEETGSRRHGFGMTLANQAAFRPVNPDTVNWEPTTLNEIPGDEAQNAWGMDTGTAFPTLKLELANEADLEREKREGIGKAAHEETWDVGGHAERRLVARDPEGQFTSGGSGEQARRDRMARRARRARKTGKAVPSLRPVAGNDVSLLELVAAVRAAPPAERERARRRHAQRGLTEVAREAREPRQAAAAETARPGVRDQADLHFAAQRAVLLSHLQLDGLFAMGNLDFLGDGSEIDTVVVPHEAGMPSPDLKPRRIREAIDDWSNEGSTTRVLSEHPSASEATAFAVDWAHGAFDPERRHDEAEPWDRTMHVDPIPGTAGRYQVRETTYEEPKVLLFGSPAAMAAVARRDPDIVLHLRQVAGDTYTLAEREGAHLSEVGSKSVPVVAIKVELPEDER
jgi:hypothetical protein